MPSIRSADEAKGVALIRKAAQASFTEIPNLKS
jgi:hypothetical protein